MYTQVKKKLSDGKPHEPMQAIFFVWSRRETANRPVLRWLAGRLAVMQLARNRGRHELTMQLADLAWASSSLVAYMHR